MSNDYFNAPSTPVDFTTARAAAVKQLFASVAAGFDLLPARDALLQGRVNYAAAAGTANAITASMTVAPESYVAGASFRLKLANTNTGPATLNINGLGAKSIVDSAGDALAGGELVANAIQDFTYDGTNFRLPATGPAGPEGPQGPTDGLSVLNGTDDPGAGDGQDGDFYINTTSWQIFGPKAAGAWPAGVDLIGADGANGTDGADGDQIIYGAAAPTGGDGEDGDTYIETTNWVVYGPKAGGVWPAGVSMVGPQGDQGDQGDPGTIDTAAHYAFTHADGIDVLGQEVGYRNLPISRTESGDITLAAADRGKAIILSNSSSGQDITVPDNTTVSIETGSIISFFNNGTNTVSVLRGSGVTMKLAGTGGNANRTLAVGGMAWVWKIDTNTWVIGGDVS